MLAPVTRLLSGAEAPPSAPAVEVGQITCPACPVGWSSWQVYLAGAVGLFAGIGLTTVICVGRSLWSWAFAGFGAGVGAATSAAVVRQIVDQDIILSNGGSSDDEDDGVSHRTARALVLDDEW